MPPKSQTASRTSDAECFSPISDVHTPAVHIPPCAKCGKPSLGGTFVAAEPVHPAGSPIFTVEFFCAEDRTEPFLMMSDRLFPCWRILNLETQSRMKIMRLSREAQFERMQE